MNSCNLFCSFRMDSYHDVRYHLKRRELIEEGPTKVRCPQHFDDPDCTSYVAVGKMQINGCLKNQRSTKTEGPKMAIFPCWCCMLNIP